MVRVVWITFVKVRKTPTTVVAQLEFDTSKETKKEINRLKQLLQENVVNYLKEITALQKQLLGKSIIKKK